MSNILKIGEEKVCIEEVFEASRSDTQIELSSCEGFRDKIARSRYILEQKLSKNEVVYGVTTGYGDSCVIDIPEHLRKKLPLQLTRYHQCGMGEIFDVQTVRAIQLVRIISLAQGPSAVRIELLEHMVSLFNAGVTARIPQEGSVGASGDLTPLSYYAATLIGEGEVIYKDQLKPSIQVLDFLGIKPIVLLEKEALALMNGTAVMTAIACKVYKQAEYLGNLCSRITALSSLGLLANSNHFNEAIFKNKPHKGTVRAAKWIRSDLAPAFENKTLTRLQDRYSIRCAPHIIGVLLDALYSFKDLIEVELNSSNDNPLVDLDKEEILHGGNFYGGHIAFVMDSLKSLIANIADLLDRQIALLVDTKFNNGLPANLSAATGDEAYLYHGLKALQISSSAWTAEALKNSMPASVFSRSTECHNQDKVSMGTISARDAVKTMKLTNQVACAAIITSIQAIEIRILNNELTEELIGEKVSNFKKLVRKYVRFVEEDRPLEGEIRALLNLVDQSDKELIE